MSRPTTDPGALRLFDLPLADRHPAPRRNHRGKRSTTRTAPSSQQLVREFHERFELPWSDAPSSDIAPALAKLRNDLLREESSELIDACEAGNLIAIADGIADVLYVVYGTAVTYGLDADALLREVHRSNMSKLGDDGRPVRRADGKILKGPNYSPPQLGRVVASTVPAAWAVLAEPSV